jgi:hypothetical protein
MPPRNHFRENRLAVLKGIEESGFLTPLVQADLPLKISENSKTASLKEVLIDDVPADEDDIRPRSWILDLEMPKPIFGSIQNTKTVEKALIVLGRDALRIFMFELKSSLQPYGESSLGSIQTKIEHTIARISMLLPIQIFGSEFNGIRIIYKGIICYNQDNEIISTVNKDANFARSDMYKAFNERKKRLTLSDVFGRTHPVELLFFKNPNQAPSVSFQIEFEDLFFADSAEWEVQEASNGEMTCPFIAPTIPS